MIHALALERDRLLQQYRLLNPEEKKGELGLLYFHFELAFKASERQRSDFGVQKRVLSVKIAEDMRQIEKQYAQLLFHVERKAAPGLYKASDKYMRLFISCLKKREEYLNLDDAPEEKWGSSVLLAQIKKIQEILDALLKDNISEKLSRVEKKDATLMQEARRLEEKNQVLRQTYGEWVRSRGLENFIEVIRRNLAAHDQEYVCRLLQNLKGMDLGDLYLAHQALKGEKGGPTPQSLQMIFFEVSAAQLAYTQNVEKISKIKKAYQAEYKALSQEDRAIALQERECLLSSLQIVALAKRQLLNLS